METKGKIILKNVGTRWDVIVATSETCHARVYATTHEDAPKQPQHSMHQPRQFWIFKDFEIYVLVGAHLLLSHVFLT